MWVVLADLAQVEAADLWVALVQTGREITEGLVSRHQILAQAAEVELEALGQMALPVAQRHQLVEVVLVV